MIKIAHESPKSIFDTVQNYTDYDYNNGGEASTDDDGSVVQFKVAASF